MTLEAFVEAFNLKESKRFKVKVGVFLFLYQEDEILLLRRYNTGIADGLYVVPMGGLTEGETATQALIREAYEETNVVIKPEHVHFCHVMHRLHRMPEGVSFTQIDLFYKVEQFEGVIQNREPHKCDELKFYPLDNLPKQTEAFIRQALKCTDRGQFFSEFGWI